MRAEGVRGSAAASGAEALAHSICLLQAASGADTTTLSHTNGLQAASGASFVWRAVLHPRAPCYVLWTAPLVRSVPLEKKTGSCSGAVAS